ncbi:hypothetical protein KR215_009589, partial [Drosophila sulfurigaster]
IDFTKLDIKNNNEELLQIDYKLNFTSQNLSTVYVKFQLSKDVEYFDGIFNLGLQHGGRTFNFTNLKFNCNGMSVIYNHYMLQLIADNIRSFSNFPLTCPYIKVLFLQHINPLLINNLYFQNKLYYVNGYSIMTSVIPSYIPEGTFTTYATVSYNQHQIVRIKSEGGMRR